MNHLDALKDMRQWPSGVRAIYNVPFDSGPDTVECWHVNDGPVFDAMDLRELGWTTADESVLDDGTLSIIDCGPTGQYIQIRPVIFEDGLGALRIGWPFAGYRDRKPWVRVLDQHPNPYPAGRLESTTADDNGGSVILNHPVGVFTYEKEPIVSNVNGPSHISGTFVVNFSDEEIDDMLADQEHDPKLELVGGQIQQTRCIGIEDLIAAAREKVSPQYAALVSGDGEVSPGKSGDGGFDVAFYFDLDI
jgi:hypothetical protein